MNDYDAIYENAMTILRSNGEWEHKFISRHQAYVYRDGKVEILAFISMMTQEVEELFIDLPLRGEKSSGHFSENTFGINSRNMQGTWVFHWEKNRVKFFRKGRWITHIQRVADDLWAELTRIRELNNQPVNDQSLFPDIDP